MAQSTPRPTTRFWPTFQSFKYDGTTHPICLHPYGLEGGQALGTCPTCTIFNASFPSWCSIGDVCCVECSFIGNLYVIFNLQHCMSLHWKYNPKNVPKYKRNGELTLYQNGNMVCICAILQLWQGLHHDHYNVSCLELWPKWWILGFFLPSCIGILG